MNNLSGRTNQYISTPFFIALTLMAMSLPLSLFMMSVMQFILLGLWAYEGYSDSSVHKTNTLSQRLIKCLHFPLYNIKTKIGRLRSNKVALIIFSLYLIPLLGLSFTSNYNLAIDELRTYLPILVLTLVIASSKPLSKTQFNSLLIFYIAAVIIGTFFGLYTFIRQDFSDIRELSIFIHPVRFSLSICFSIFLMIYFIFKNEFENIYINILFSISIIWLIYFLILMESGMGLTTLFIISMGLLLYTFVRIKSIHSYLYLIPILLFPLLSFLYISNVINNFYDTPTIDLERLESKSPLGNIYTYDSSYGVEDGKIIGLYICESELKSAWKQRSNLAFEGLDMNRQELKRTLIRFLTSLDLRKDAAGIAQLTDEHILAIEKGIANIHYLKNPGIKTRIHKFLIGYKNYKVNGNPNGNSLIQRFEYWKASIQIIKKHFWTGVGTGDIRSEFDKYYDASNSKLEVKNRGISHNQYFNIMVSFGVFGLAWFLFVILYPLHIKSLRKDYYYIIFISIILLSMLSVDTIKNQAGISLFVFFNALFLFGRNSKEQL